MKAVGLALIKGSPSQKVPQATVFVRSDTIQIGREAGSRIGST
jgi:hypothetical protein